MSASQFAVRSKGAGLGRPPVAAVEPAAPPAPDRRSRRAEERGEAWPGGWWIIPGTILGALLWGGLLAALL
jgi:hypothetical protein